MPAVPFLCAEDDAHMTLLSQMTIPPPPTAAPRSQRNLVSRFPLGLKFISPFPPPPPTRSSSSQEPSFRASYPLIYDARFSQLMPYLDIAADDFLGKCR